MMMLDVLLGQLARPPNIVHKEPDTLRKPRVMGEEWITKEVMCDCVDCAHSARRRIPLDAVWQTVAKVFEPLADNGG